MIYELTFTVNGMETYKTSLISKKTIADGILELRLNKPEFFNFQAGQFIQIIAPHGEKQVFRSYSLSSTPQHENLELCVKLYETGIASKLFESLDIGKELSFKGPAGRFVMNSIETDVYFIATGVGLAPIMGIIRDELQNNHNKNNLHLIFGVRHEKDIFWKEELDELEKKYSNFSYSLTLSQPAEAWQGLRGRVTEHIPENTSNLHTFLCGSADMVKNVRDMLISRGTEISKIHFEIF